MLKWCFTSICWVFFKQCCGIGCMFWWEMVDSVRVGVFQSSYWQKEAHVYWHVRPCDMTLLHLLNLCFCCWYPQFWANKNNVKSYSYSQYLHIHHGSTSIRRRRLWDLVDLRKTPGLRRFDLVILFSGEMVSVFLLFFCWALLYQKYLRSWGWWNKIAYRLRRKVSFQFFKIRRIAIVSRTDILYIIKRKM